MTNDSSEQTINLRTRFRDFYQSARPVHAGLIGTAVYVLDTNVLLKMYRIPKSSREELLNDLQEKSDRVWMPFQVALELHRNCDAVRSAQTKSHLDRIKGIDDFVKVMSLNGKSTRLVSSPEQKAAITALNAWKAKLENENEAIRDEINHQKTDEVLERIADIFGTSIGPEPTSADYEQFHKEAKERYNNSVPPGYADRDKDDYRGDGDLIVWKQTMEYAKSAQMDIVFVTDDNKEDWKVRLNSKVLRARPELIVEFQQVTGRDISIIDSNKFFYEISSRQASEKAKEALHDLRQVVRDDDEQDALFLKSITELNHAIANRDKSNNEILERYGHRLVDIGATSMDSNAGDRTRINPRKIRMMDMELDLVRKKLSDTNARIASSVLMLEKIKSEGDLEAIEAATMSLEDLLALRSSISADVSSLEYKIAKVNRQSFG